MRSAGGPSTPALVTRLVSLESKSRLYSYTQASRAWKITSRRTRISFRVSAETAECVNAARAAGHRVIAVETTVVRALGTVTDRRGRLPAAAAGAVLPGRNRVRRKSVQSNRCNGATFQLFGAV